MKWLRGWRRWAVKPSDLFEPALRRAICEPAQGTLVQEMLAYHFGYAGAQQPRRGKRLRPRLVLAVAQEAGASPDDALDAALAIELLHNYSLIHDDIEDRDMYRHGRETLWVKYGVAQAINAGDALCALSFLSLLHASQRHPAGIVTAMVSRLHEAHFAMCVGQSLDLAFEVEHCVALEEYLRMIAGKTAALFEVACELGALCAGAPRDAVQRYRELGAAFGMAFQMHDDALGIWGDSQSTGKTSGSDIAQRKKTYPIAWALAGTPGPERSLVADAYTGEGPLRRETIDRVIAALDVLGAREAVHASAAKHLAVVERAPAGPVRDFLLSLLPATAVAEETLPS